jgi:hypothetical protein
MSWDCKSCGAAGVSDNLNTCPECARVKTAWTLVVDRTRTLTISRKKFVLQRGDGSRSGPASESPVTLYAAEKITVFTKQELRALADQGHVPASAYVVFVTLYPRQTTDLTVELAVLYENQASEQLSFPDAATPGGEDVHYAQFVFAYGDGDLEGIEFPDMTVVDLSELDGFAPSVEFSALGKKEQELPTTATKLRQYAFSI